ncbi:MAG: response regulator [Candidatus Eremiobacterota bacterium]
MLTRKILLVDDEPYIIKSLCFVLEKKGYNVLCANNGEDALDKIKSYRPDLVLLDVMMPKKNGYDVCLEIRKYQEFKNLYIIMLTAKSQDADKEKGLQAGANEYFTKPFSPVKMLQRLEEIFSGKK